MQRILVISAMVMALSLAMAPSVKAADPLFQEAFQSEVVYPQAEGQLQVTLKPGYQKTTASTGWQFPLNLEYGLTPAWELDITWNAFMSRTPTGGTNVSGIGDVTLGTKYAFMGLGDGTWHAATGFNFSYPVADVDKGLTEGFLTAEPYVVLAKDMPDWADTQIYTHIGLGYVSRNKNHSNTALDQPAAHTLDWNTGVVVPVANTWRLTAELNWSNNKWNNSGAASLLYATPGIIWNGAQAWELGLGVPVGLTTGTDNYRVMALITYQLETVKKGS